MRFLITIVIHIIIIVNSKIATIIRAGGIIMTNFVMVSLVIPPAETVHSTLNMPKNGVSFQLSDTPSSVSGITDTRERVEVLGVS